MKTNLSSAKSLAMVALLVVSVPFAASNPQPLRNLPSGTPKVYLVSPTPQTSTVFDSLEAQWQIQRGVAQVNASFVSLSETNVVSFQFLYATDPGGIYQPASDVLPAQGVDGSVYYASFTDPNPGGPLYVMVIATMSDNSTQTSSAVLVLQAASIGVPAPGGTSRGGSQSSS